MVILQLLLGVALALCAHELGHVLAAKALGMEVRTVKLFLGKGLMAWRMWGAQWTIAWLPLGAYTTIPDALRGQQLWRRAAVIAGGPVTSALMALLCVYALSIGIDDGQGWLLGFAVANAALGLLSLSPVTGADSPALIALIANHWFLGTGGRITIGLLWFVFPIGFALLMRSLPTLCAVCW